MPEKFDKYEERWGDFGEDTRHRKVAHHQKKQAEDNAPKEPEKTPEQIQNEAESKILRHIESRWGILTPEYRSRKLKVYFKWVKSSLEEGYAILDDGDLGERHEDEKSVLTHEPTLIGAKKKNSEEAKGVVFERLESHLKPWKVLTEENRKKLYAMAEVAEPQKPEIRFIFTRHAERDALPVWERIKDADIIIQEAFGIDPEDKTEVVELSRNNIVANDQRTSQEVEAYLMKKYPKGSLFVRKMISLAILNGKELHLADVSLHSEGANASRIADDLEKEATYHATLGFFESAYKYFLEMQSWGAKSMITRDYSVAIEVLELIEKNKKEWQGKKVAVVYGLQHTNMYKVIKKENPEANMQKVFMSSKIGFSLEHEIRQRLLMGQEFPTELFRRNFLEHFVVIPYLKSFNEPQVGLFDVSERIVRKMTDSEVEEAFAKLDEIESGITDGSVDERISDVNSQILALGRSVAMAVGDRS